MEPPRVRGSLFPSEIPKPSSTLELTWYGDYLSSTVYVTVRLTNYTHSATVRNVKRLRNVFLSDPDSAALVLGGAAVLLGLKLLLPVQTWATGTTNYQTMASVVSEEVWGAGIVLAGITTFVGTVLGRRNFQRFGALAVFSFRILQLGLVAVGSGFLAPGIADFLSWSLASAWVYLRVTLNIGRTRRVG